MSRRIDPFGLAALAGAGTLAAHQVGYLADGASDVSHAYLGLLGPVVVLVSCVAAWVASIRVLRNDAGRLPSFGLLAWAQVSLFVLMEVAERAVSGFESLMSAPVLIGLFLQPVVAWAALLLLSLGRRVLETLRPATKRLPAARLVAARAPVSILALDSSCARLRLRGPPVG